MQINGVTIEKIGFLGLGVMGESMCHNLSTKSAIPLYGYDPRPEPLQRLAASGVNAATSVKDVATHCELVFLCLASDKLVEQVCFGPDSLTDDSARVKVIVDCGTTSVALTREAAARCAQRGVIWIDAPIARGREGARAGTLAFMVGAKREYFEALMPLLSTMGTDVIFCGDVSSGQIVKILNNKVVLQQVHALAEALAIGTSLGVDGKLLFDAFEKGSADCKALRAQGRNHLLTGDFPPETFSTLYARKDIGHALGLAEEAHVDASLAQTTCDLLDRSLDAGFEKDYYPIFLNLLQQPT